MADRRNPKDAPKARVRLYRNYVNSSDCSGGFSTKLTSAYAIMYCRYGDASTSRNELYGLFDLLGDARRCVEDMDTSLFKICIRAFPIRWELFK